MNFPIVQKEECTFAAPKQMMSTEAPMTIAEYTGSIAFSLTAAFAAFSAYDWSSVS